MRAIDAVTCSASRRRWTLRGQLQGVGFRPFVYRLATEMGLSGFVRNDSSCVIIEAQGRSNALDELGRRIVEEVPTLAKIADVQCESAALVPVAGFEIRPSEPDAAARATLTIDSAVCPDCLKDLFDPANFRVGYPLINCTNCGPRYSIIRATPYDRDNTTMSRFKLCEKCHQEYADPINRRFHAQPVACHSCGPRAGLWDFAAGKCDWIAPIAKAAALLRAGKIVALKGIGGFHLACRADDEAAVSQLRRRKHRDAKPFAVMCRDLETVRTLVTLSSAAEKELTAPAAPIILAKQKSKLAHAVALDSHRLGVMLPYTPLHHLLFAELGESVSALVMTSANIADEPLIKDNAEAIARLSGLAQAILLHERDIQRSIDDSVLIDMGEEQTPLPIRRARGYVPAVVLLPRRNNLKLATVGLCVGAELKSTTAVARGHEVIISHHLGDLKHTLSYEYFRQATLDLCQLFEARPQWIAHDLHPAYLSTQWAKDLAHKWDVPLIGVQHHHAHAAAVLAEHGVTEVALAIVCDGAGYGPDATVWGGELLLLDNSTFARLAHLRTIPLAGGDQAARHTGRSAAGVLWEMGQDSAGLFEDPLEAAIVSGMLKSGENVIKSSSAGRLFDAAAAMLGICNENSHEAQAAMALESLAASYKGANVPTSEIKNQKSKIKNEIDILQFIVDLKPRHEDGEDSARLAWEFHEIFAQAWAAATIRASADTGVKIVALSGGVFCNEILTKRISALLSGAGLRVLRHKLVPPNDGGISFGQAAIASQIYGERG